LSAWKHFLSNVVYFKNSITFVKYLGIYGGVRCGLVCEQPHSIGKQSCDKLKCNDYG